MNQPYSPWKLIHHPDRIAAMRRGEQVAPLQVQLIISDLCNQDCNFCAYRMSGYTSNQHFNGVDKHGNPTHNPTRFIPFPKILEILDDCAELGVKAIQLTGGGEPSVHPFYVQVLQAIRARGLDLAVVSNGVVVKPDAVPHLLRATWLRFSLDAGTAETYTLIRRAPHAHYERVLSNIEDLTARRALSSVGPKPTIGVGFVVTADNYREIAQAAKKVRELGVDNLRVSALFTQDDEAYHAPIHEAVREEIARAKAFETEYFQVVDLYGDRLSDLRQHSPDYSTCGIMQLNTYIGGDLNVYRCCTTAYNDQGLIGSLQGQRFIELWRSQKKELDFARFDARTCTRCMFNGKNRFINYATSRYPEHVNYI